MRRTSVMLRVTPTSASSAGVAGSPGMTSNRTMPIGLGRAGRSRRASRPSAMPRRLRRRAARRERERRAVGAVRGRALSCMRAPATPAAASRPWAAGSRRCPADTTVCSVSALSAGCVVALVARRRSPGSRSCRSPSGVTSIVTVAIAPSARSPRSQVTVPAACRQVPWLGVADTNADARRQHVGDGHAGGIGGAVVGDRAACR